MTRARQLVLESLKASPVPRSPGQIVAAVGESCDQATVYRALHWLESQGYLGSFIFHCSDHGTERYYAIRELAHRHWLHCVHCHAFVDLGACILESAIMGWEDSLGIRVHSHNLQLSGLCPDCRAAGPSPMPEDSSLSGC